MILKSESYAPSFCSRIFDGRAHSFRLLEVDRVLRIVGEKFCQNDESFTIYHFCWDTVVLFEGGAEA